MNRSDFVLLFDTGLTVFLFTVLLALLRRLALINKKIETLRGIVSQLDFYQRQMLRFLSEETKFQLKDSFPVSEIIEALDNLDTGF